MFVSFSVTGEETSGGRVTYEYYVAGNEGDVETETEGGLLLAGGDSDVRDGMKWMIEKSGGGDFVVIRCSGTEAYNPWIYSSLKGVDSCETIIILSSEACYDDFVISKIESAEALFIAGGNQWDYVKLWKDTPVEDAIHAVAAKPAPVGGTSAGLAVLGEFVFSAEKNTIESADALRNPFASRLTIATDFLNLENMEETITDSHFVARDRMGRLVAFMARIALDNGLEDVKGIGVNEKTYLGVEPSGLVTLFGLGPDSAAYFLRTPGLPEVCEDGVPLTFEDLSVYRITGGATFNIVDWTGEGGTQYTISAIDGVLSTNQADGSIY